MKKKAIGNFGKMPILNIIFYSIILLAIMFLVFSTGTIIEGIILTLVIGFLYILGIIFGIILKFKKTKWSAIALLIVNLLTLPGFFFGGLLFGALSSDAGTSEAITSGYIIIGIALVIVLINLALAIYSLVKITKN